MTEEKADYKPVVEKAKPPVSPKKDEAKEAAIAVYRNAKKKD